MDLILRLDSIITMLEQIRGNAIVVCDRAVCRVLLGYFDAHHAKEGLAQLPNIEVSPGVIELRRSHSGFSCTHTVIEEGEASRAAGPGTNQSGQVRTAAASHRRVVPPRRAVRAGRQRAPHPPTVRRACLCAQTANRLSQIPAHLSSLSNTGRSSPAVAQPPADEGVPRVNTS
jgi:hypothetical protein